MSSVEYSSCSKAKRSQVKRASSRYWYRSNDAPPIDTQIQQHNSSNCILEYVYSFLFSSTGPNDTRIWNNYMDSLHRLASRLFLTRVKLLPERNAEFLAETLKGVEILLVLIWVLDLGLDSCFLK